jgi:5-methylcytosine-specific restriction protein B
MAETARRDPSSPHVLIVDEINRGNIAKIFGELYFLLEYRDESIRLQYSGSEEFSIPPNLLLIGTMNTADRSIALIDGALRRRFKFVEFDPARAPVEKVLELWLGRNDLDLEPAVLLDALNRAIDDDDFRIGPSYFMTHDGTDPDLESVWRHEILPLLEEHYYGSRRDVRREFGLAALRKQIEEEADQAEGEEPPGGLLSP